MKFESANPAIVKSIRQRELLNVWIRSFERSGKVPSVADFTPERFADELPDLGFCSVVSTGDHWKVQIKKDGSRLASMYGGSGQGLFLDDYVGPEVAALIIPGYVRCIERALPVFTSLLIKDVNDTDVLCERLLLPFMTSSTVDNVIASVKPISESGDFVLRNLMSRSAPAAPVVPAVIDTDLSSRLRRGGKDDEIV